MKGFYQKIEQDVKTHGRSVLNVFARPTFSYSIGNRTKDLPELILFGVPPHVATGIINEISDQMLQSGKPEDGTMVRLAGGRHPVKLVYCVGDVRQQYTVQAGQFLRSEDYAVMQIVVPDPQGLFPHQPGCDDVYRNLPYLGKTLQ